VQEIVWLSELKYDVLDCLKPPYYFIPKGSVPIENHAGHNLATHAKLVEPKWIGVPLETSNEIVKELIQKVLCQSIVLTRFSDQILYSFQSDRQFLQEQNNKYGWNYDWTDNEKWQNCTFNTQNRLIDFNCSLITQLEELDVSQCTQLQKLSCYNTRIKELDICQCTQLKVLWCSYTQIEELDVSQCTQLRHLDCLNNQIKELDVSQCTQLQELYCSKTQIKELDVSQCTQLHTVWCHNTQIKELDVRQCTQLQKLWCHNTQIKELDLSQCTQLQILDCSNTQIKELDVSQCTQLQQLYCSKDVKIIGDVSNVHVTRN
jgi:Leucine-rich repeat (LRR) protein